MLRTFVSQECLETEMVPVYLANYTYFVFCALNLSLLEPREAPVPGDTFRDHLGKREKCAEVLHLEMNCNVKGGKAADLSSLTSELA